MTQMERLEQAETGAPTLLERIRPKHIVGIGASAGGLEALEQVFQHMPRDTGAAFVVIQHLSPDFESMMDELLIRKTKMSVQMASDGAVVQADSIYLIPPKKEMIISDGRLFLKDKDPEQGLSLPIDQFFRSLARDIGADSVAIVLSGSGSDGSRGICDVHQAGGLVIAQSEETAKFDGMPKSAVETGMVDLILPPSEIGMVLGRYVLHPIRHEFVAESKAMEVNEPSLKRLIRLLRDEHGIDFSVYKQSTVLRRIERRLLLSDTRDFEEYVSRVANHRDELHALYRDLLIGVTQFFRDRDAFAVLENQVLPELFEHHSENEEFRVWVPGCATGEEAYSLAILLDERLPPDRLARVKIFATDVHQASLDFASAGAYSLASMAHVSPARIDKYFVRHGDEYQVSKNLRQLIVFAQQNVVKDAPFTRLNLISCRNLLIYLQPGVQRKVISLFHFGLKTNGALMLGPSEGVGDLEDEFRPLDRHWKIYSKRRDVRLHGDLKLSLGTRSGSLPLVGWPRSEPARFADSDLSNTYDELLNQFLPPSVLINQQREIVHVIGDAGSYLKIRRGRATKDVLDMFESDLRTAISGAIQRVAREGKPTAYTGINFAPQQQIRIRVIPLFGRDGQMTYSLITFEPLPQQSRPATESNDGPVVDLGAASRDRIQALEEELRHTKENLQATIEELEVSNEELQATNEELVASNEEMQSTNEELHSVNEELYTVNAEYQRKICELTEMTEDMNHLLASTDVGVLFLDDDLAIRKFTPRMARLFNIIEQDVGRAFESFTHNICYDRLIEDVRRVLADGQPVETDVVDRNGHDYLLRILPYRVHSDVDGVVVTLIDVASLKSAEAQLRERDIRFQGILDNSPSFIFIKDLEGRYLVANAQSIHVFGRPPRDLIGRSNHELLPSDLADQLKTHDMQVSQAGRTIEIEETIPLNGRSRTYLSVKFPLRDQRGEICAIAGIKTDITRRKLAQRKAQRAIRQRDQFLAMLSHELRNPLAAIQNAGGVLQRLDHSDQRLTAVTEVIHRQSDQLARILDDLLDISRVIQGKVELKKTIFDFRDSAKNAIWAVRSLASSGAIQLHKHIQPRPLPVFGDQARLQQVVVNLLVNAIKYTNPGGTVELSLTGDSHHAVLSVRDSGVGMSESLIKRIFEPFVQGETTLDRARGGMGVGLTLVKSLTELHDGVISASSSGPNQGSTFTLTLPLSKESVSAETTMDSLAPVDVPQLKIVVVEDNEDSRTMMKMLLEIDGHQVFTVADGLAAIELIQAEKPDLAFIDIGLPELDGYQVIQRLQDAGLASTTLFIALTGYGQPRDLARSRAAGFQQHITKPVHAPELNHALVWAATRKAKILENQS